MYYNGEGVEQDYVEAVKWITLAAEQGNSFAQNSLGLAYYNGEGVVQNMLQATKWYTMSAKQGNPIAQHNLGWMYYDGKGVAQDYVLAHMWVNIAAINGADYGVISRDSIAPSLTLADVRIAQTLANECISSDYENCGY